MPDYHRPDALEQATALLASEPRTILAGGTDLYPATKAQSLGGRVLDLNGIDALRGITGTPEGWRIGALATWTDMLRADLPPAFDGLKRAAREVGSIQIQNAGTVAGNLCNASPAADGVPPLLTLDAVVEIASTRGTRSLPLGEFLRGPRATDLRADELVSAILVPREAGAGVSGFLKLGARKYLVISIAMVAARIEIADGRIGKARIAVGSCSATARRLVSLEAALAGHLVADALSQEMIRAHASDALAPIDDIRGTAGYRTEAAVELILRVLQEMLA